MPNETEATVTQEDLEQAKRAAMLDKLKTQFFTGQEGLAAAGALITQIQDAGIPLRMNYIMEEIDFPTATHGLLVQVLKHRVKKKTIPTGEVLVAAVPTVESVGDFGDAGQAFLMEAVEGILASRVVNAVRAAKEGTDSFIPFTIEDFITKRTITSEYGDYNKLAKIFVAALKKGKGFEILTPSILRNVLMSTAMSKSIFPNIQQDWWRGVLNKMVEYCGQASPNLETGIFEAWLETRDTVSSVTEVEELSLDDLSLELAGSLASGENDGQDEEEDDGDGEDGEDDDEAT